MDLSNLQPAEGATEERKRIGRGAGSGYGGHSSTRGTKGQKSRSGGKISVYFEGGQTPLVQRVPKFGFNSPFRTEYRPVNVKRLQRLADEDRLDASEPVTPEVLVEIGEAQKSEPIKILGDGEIDAALDVQVHAFSDSAREKIEEAGGTASVVE
jgi:large subunit ribosomal protein L15